MKLTKIYSNNPAFKEVVFNDHLNIVLGSIKNPDKIDNDSHNLGKTTLISLIDFLLLKEIDKSHFLKDPIFKKDIFFLEIYLNNGKSLTIKRSVEQNTKISIKIHSERYVNFVEESNWDYQDHPLTSKDESKNPKHILNSFINLKIDGNTYFYRDIITYFTRNQNDYTDIFKLSKYQGKDVDWKPSLFTLLGFNGTYLEKKYVLEQEINSKEELIKKIEKEFSVDSNEKEKIKNLITIKDKKINELKIQMDTFDFIKSENSDLESLVTNIEKEISNLNTQKYKLFTEVKRIRESLNQKMNFDYQKVFSLFEEVNILFNEKLKKDYKDLIEFNTLLTKDRSKYLKINLEEKQMQITEIDTKLSTLSSERKRKLSYLGTTDNFKKYKELQLKLIELEKEKEKMLTKIEYADQMKQSQSQINKLKSDLSLLVEKIDTIISDSNSYFDTIRDKYISFLRQVINKDAILYLNQNSNGNVDFKSSVLNEDKETKEGDGNTYKKIMCASFDIAILDTYIAKDFIKFVIHDGVFESLEGRRKTSYLNFIKGITTSSNIQYIFTAIEEDLDPQFLTENKDAVCVTLSDDDEYKGTLFGKRF